VDTTHLGTLFVLDKTKDGKFDFQEVLDFGKLYIERESSNTDSDFQVFNFSQSSLFQSHFRAYCTLLMWNEVCKADGVDNFVEWFANILCENLVVHYFKSHPNVVFLSSDTVKTMHKVQNLLLS
jgi:hypothetical protein